jgi:hypothetical protein
MIKGLKELTAFDEAGKACADAMDEMCDERSDDSRLACPCHKIVDEPGARN